MIRLIITFIIFALSTNVAKAEHDLPIFSNMSQRIKKKESFIDSNVNRYFRRIMSVESDNEATLSCLTLPEWNGQFEFRGHHRFWRKYLKRYFRREYRSFFNRQVLGGVNPSRSLMSFEKNIDIAESIRHKNSLDIRYPWEIPKKKRRSFVLGKDRSLIDGGFLTLSSDFRMKIHTSWFPKISHFLGWSPESDRRVQGYIFVRTIRMDQIPYEKEAKVTTIRFKMKVNIKTRGLSTEIRSIGFRVFGVIKPWSKDVVYLVRIGVRYRPRDNDVLIHCGIQIF